MSKVREFFDDVQMAAESGGRQHDKDGKPLVGRYRDGSTPKGDKKAYGAGQMQVGTAKNTAAQYGIPWDEQRFFNDKDYNLDLADKHMQHLTQKYGDRTIARAAYHQGEPTVDKAIQKYGRAGFAQGIGPEGKKYIQMGQSGASGKYNSSESGQGIANPQAYLDGLESQLGPEAKASGGVTQQSQAIFGSDAALKEGAAKVADQLTIQGDQINVLDQAMQVAQSAAREAMTRQVSETRDVSNEIVQGTNELKKKVTPVFKARERVADQLDKLVTMNPLERGIRGIFDLNYDKDYLEGQLDDFDRTLKARESDYDYLNKLHGTALQEIGRRYTMDTAIPELLAKQAEEDLGLTGMRITQTAAMLGNLKDSIQTESQLIAAKQLARGDLLNRLDTPTTIDLMTQAQQNNGIVKFNGVEFSYKELRDKVEVGERQELEAEAYRMSIASGRMEMAEKYATNLARSLTRPQLEAAIQNGGVHNGVQLPQDTLTGLYNSTIQRDNVRAETIANQMPAKLAMETAADSLRSAAGLSRRARGLFGNQAMNGAEPYIARSGQLARELIAATQRGDPPEVITALTQKVAENTNEHMKFVDSRILAQVGGDERAAKYLKGFVYGTELSPGTAAEALTYFAMKGNLPEGVSLSPEARQVFQKAQKLVTKHRETTGANGKPINEQTLQGIVTRELTDSASQIMGQARHDKLYSDLPGVAKAAQHPFSKFPQQRWSEIRAEAAMTAAESVAKGLNTTPQAVLQMLRTANPISNDEAGKQLLAATEAQAAYFNGVEIQTTVQLLDNEPLIQPGRRNSSVLSDFLGSPNFAQGIASYGRSLGSQTMGEYLVNPLISGATERNFLDTRQNVLDAQARTHASARQLAQNPQTNMLMKAVPRTTMILQAIPGVNKEGAASLQPFVQKFFSEYLVNNFSNGIESPNSRFRREDAALRDALQSAKFDDPRMEAYRKQAVKQWDEHATAQQGFIERTLDGLFGDAR